LQFCFQFGVYIQMLQSRIAAKLHGLCAMQVSATLKYAS